MQEADPQTSDPSRPYPPHKRLNQKETAAYLGVTDFWLKRARHDRLIPFVRARRVILYKVADLDAYLEANRVEAAPKKPIRRERSPEHNAKIGAAVRAAKAKKAAAAKKVGR